MKKKKQRYRLQCEINIGFDTSYIRNRFFDAIFESEAINKAKDFIERKALKLRGPNDTIDHAELCRQEHKIIWTTVWERHF